MPGRLDGLATAPVPSQPVGKSRRRTERGRDGKDSAATDLEAQPRKGTPAGQGNECAKRRRHGDTGSSPRTLSFHRSLRARVSRPARHAAVSPLKASGRGVPGGEGPAHTGPLHPSLGVRLRHQLWRRPRAPRLQKHHKPRDATVGQSPGRRPHGHTRSHMPAPPSGPTRA